MDLSFLLILKYLLTVFTIVLIPTYWKTYGLGNFLWFSDIGLFLTVLALWCESSLLISIPAILILPFEIVWIIDYSYRLTTRRRLLNIVHYMFENKYPLWIRALSLFHIFLPLIWICLLIKWGYDAHALIYAILLCWFVLLLCYFFTKPSENVNWSHLASNQHWKLISPRLWIIFLLIAFPLFIILPMHFLLHYLF